MGAQDDALSGEVLAHAVPRSFAERLAAAFSAHGQLCVGIDPHRSLLEQWELPDSAAGAREFGLRVVQEAEGHVGIIKLQVAFFERFGAAGYTALEAVLAAARQAGLLIIADAKRGDIGSSVDAYAQAWLGAGSPLESDAMTVSAYQGVDSLTGSVALAESEGKGLFVLAATSNPEASIVQRAQVQQGTAGGMSVARAIIDGVVIQNRQRAAAGVPGSIGPPGSIGVVIGATADLAALGIDAAYDTGLAGIPVLAPGFGHQGAQVSDIRSIYGVMTPGVIVTQSRSILSAGPFGLRDEIIRNAREVAEAIG